MFETMERSQAASLWSRLVSGFLRMTNIVNSQRVHSNRLDLEEMPASQQKDIGLGDGRTPRGHYPAQPTAFDAARDIVLRRSL
jgi:hypothetical protein